jgi:hypothetical protein
MIDYCVGNGLVQKIMIPCSNEVTEKMAILHHELSMFRTSNFIIPEIIDNFRLIKFSLTIKK